MPNSPEVGRVSEYLNQFNKQFDFGIWLKHRCEILRSDRFDGKRETEWVYICNLLRIFQVKFTVIDAFLACSDLNPIIYLEDEVVIIASILQVMKSWLRKFVYSFTASLKGSWDSNPLSPNFINFKSSSRVNIISSSQLKGEREVRN